MRSFGTFVRSASAVLVFASATLRAQEPVAHPYAVSVGVGVAGVAAPSYVDQLNAQINPSDWQRLGKVSTALDLTLTPEYRFAPRWSAALEYGLLLNAHDVTGANGTLEYRATVHMPTALVLYGMQGGGFWWKAGGGIGYYFASLRQQFQGIDPAFEGHANGPALKIQATVGAALARSFYGTAAVEFRAAFLGALKDANGTPLHVAGKDVNLTFASFGLRLGATVEL